MVEPVAVPLPVKSDAWPETDQPGQVLARQGTLTTGGTGTVVTLTEVTDPTLKRQVLALRSGGTPPENYPSFATQDPAVFEVTPG